LEAKDRAKLAKFKENPNAMDEKEQIDEGNGK
jgi:hypothetical protein